MSARRAFARFPRSTDAAASIEFALILPFTISLFAGIVEVGRAFQVFDATSKLASQYAVAWSDCSDIPTGACQTEMNTYASSNTIANIAPQIISSKLTLTMFQVQMSGTTPVVTYAYPSGGSLNAAQTTAARTTIPSGQTGVVVTANYAHTLAYFPSWTSSYLGSRLTANYTIVQLKS